jgi:hypothetical protein
MHCIVDIGPNRFALATRGRAYHLDDFWRAIETMRWSKILGAPKAWVMGLTECEGSRKSGAAPDQVLVAAIEHIDDESHSVIPGHCRANCIDTKLSMVLFMRRENSFAKWRTRSGISSGRSRNGGISTGKTFKRKKRSERNFRSPTIASKSRLVAAIRRTSARRVPGELLDEVRNLAV